MAARDPASVDLTLISCHAMTKYIYIYSSYNHGNPWQSPYSFDVQVWERILPLLVAAMQKHGASAQICCLRVLRAGMPSGPVAIISSVKEISPPILGHKKWAIWLGESLSKFDKYPYYSHQKKGCDMIKLSIPGWPSDMLLPGDVGAPFPSHAIFSSGGRCGCAPK